jgi:Ca2+/Na+ antiporter
MLNQVLTHELFSRAQIDAMTKSLDDWLTIYTEAVLVFFIVALILVAWLIFSEARQTSKKIRRDQHALNEHHLLLTDSQSVEAKIFATSTGGR